MPRIEIKIPKYTTAEVIAVVGVRLETLKQWRKRGHLRLSMENPGRGRQRLYSLLDVYNIAVINELSGLGFFSFSEYAVSGLAEGPIIDMAMNDEGVQADWKDNGKPKRFIHIFFNGEAPEVSQSDEPSINKGIWLTIDTIGLFSEVKNQIEAISKDRLSK